MSLVVSSIVSVTAVHFCPPSAESQYCKSKEHWQNQCGSRISKISLQPVASSQFQPLSPTFCLSAVIPFVYTSSSSPTLLGRSRSVSNSDSPSPTSFSSPFLNSPAFSIGSMPRKIVGQSRSSLLTDDTITDETTRREEGGGTGGNNGGGEGGGGGGGGDAISWISSALVFSFWAGLLVYAFTMSPNQTQNSDTYLLEKLLGLHSDDGFIMNKVLVAEWYIMGCWPLVYTSLLIPSGRSRKNGVKVAPFAVASIFAGAFALLPYFGLWRPPPAPVSRDERRRLPLKVLESKITAVVAIVAGIVLAGYAGFAGADQWIEFIQYFRESRFIHIMSIDFLTLSVLAPFWVYNDHSLRTGSDKVSWLVPLSVIPYLGPALYLYLRPTLASATISDESQKISDTTTSS